MGSWGDFKAASFQGALLTAQKGGRSSQVVSRDVGKSNAAQASTGPGSSGSSRKRNLNNAATSADNQLPMQPPSTEIPNPKYCLKLITSHVDTPFKFVAVPDTEEWSPTDDELGRKVAGLYLKYALFEIIRETGLWDTFCSLNHCMFKLLYLDVLLLITSFK
jgi:hypothetical protein